MAVTTLKTSWLGYDNDTGKLVFWNGTRFRPLEEAAGYATVGHTHAIDDVSDLQTSLDAKLDAAGGTISGALSVGDALSVSGEATFSSGLTAASLTTTGTATVAAAVIGTTDVTGDGTEIYIGPGPTKVWHQGNDGSGSGLDADQLDGQDSGFYTDIPARLGYTPFNAAGGTVGGNTSISGTFNVIGDVGIGTASPDADLHLRATHQLGLAADSETLVARFQDSFADSGNRNILDILTRAHDTRDSSWRNSAMRLEASIDDNGNAQSWIEFRHYVSTTDNAIAFGEAGGGGNQWMIIRNGNVGIGTGSPGALLDVNGTANISSDASVGGTLDAAAGSIGGTPLTGDGDDLFADGRRLAVEGEGHYRLKGITRLFSGTSVAIASDTRAVLIKGVAGGGGGGGAEGGASGAAAGGGGAGGACFEAWKTDVAGQTLSYSIGAGGSAGSSSGGNGGTGGTTSVSHPSGWTLSADGGTGGNGQSNANFAQATAGGFGQNASGGDLNIGGEAGTGAIRLDAFNNLAGKGASSLFGAGGQAFAGNAAGQQGLGHGAGGGGGAVASNATGRAGGAGSDGYIEIWEYT